MTESKQDPVVFRFFNEIGIIDQLIQARMESVLPDGLRMSHFAMLNHLVRLGGQWSPARLAAAFQVTKAAITNTMKRLEARGLIRVENDPGDGRGKLVSLTEAGYEMRNLCIENLQPYLVELQQHFDDESFEAALPLLEALRGWLDEHRQG